MCEKYHGGREKCHGGVKNCEGVKNAIEVWEMSWICEKGSHGVVKNVMEVWKISWNCEKCHRGVKNVMRCEKYHNDGTRGMEHQNTLLIICHNTLSLWRPLPFTTPVTSKSFSCSCQVLICLRHFVVGNLEGNYTSTPLYYVVVFVIFDQSCLAVSTVTQKYMSFSKDLRRDMQLKEIKVTVKDHSDKYHHTVFK